MNISIDRPALYTGLDLLQHPTMRAMRADPKPKLILASRSERRRELLQQAGYVFEQRDPPFQDPPRPAQNGSTDPNSVVTELAKQKALSVRDRARASW